MAKFHLLSLGQLPYFDKREYLELIEGLFQDEIYLSDERRNRDEQLLQALVQILSL